MEFVRNIIRLTAAFFQRAKFYLREYLFPGGCGMCGGVLAGMDESLYGLCGNCRKMIDMPEISGSGLEHCMVCGRPLVSELSQCLSCRSRKESGDILAADRLLVLFPYIGTYRNLLRAYKFGKNIALGNFFAGRIREAMKKFGTDTTDAVLVPVPPRHGKIRKIGWDQIEYLAKVLETRQSICGDERASVSRCLQRLPSSVQKELNREDRRRNLNGRIRLVRPAPKVAILFDDVITTGSTMDACALALKAGGTERVFGICLFYD